MPPAVPRRLHLFVTVWGESHVERWARQSLASQLSAGNLPALAARGVQLDYHVFTDTASLSLLRERTRALQDYAEVHLRDTATHIYGATTFAAHVAGKDETRAKHTLNAASVEWMIEHALILGGAPALAILDNDFLLADGALDDAFTALRHGARVLAVPVLRLAAETIPRLLERLAALAPGAAGPAMTDLCSDLPDTLHPISRRLDVASPHFSPYPTSMLWPVGDEGWLCRSFLPHPLMLVPVRSRWRAFSTVDYSLALFSGRDPGSCRLPQPHDRIAVFKCTPEGIYRRERYPQGRLDDAKMCDFLYFQTSRGHGRFARQPVRLPRRLSATAASEARWTDAEAATLAQLEAWYARLDQHGPGVDPGASAALWRASHYGSVEQFLCPGLVLQVAERDPALRAFLPQLGRHYMR